MIGESKKVKEEERSGRIGLYFFPLTVGRLVRGVLSACTLCVSAAD